MTKINPLTRLYAVFGRPVGHSMSPLMHNHWFGRLKQDAVYLAFDVDRIDRAMAAMRHLNISGASVTIPFKSAVMDCLDAVDPLARRIGAVNTVINRDGVLTGYNTDCSGAVTPLKKQISLNGALVAVLGAGGAARAVGFGVVEEGAHVIIVNRNSTRGQALADHLKARFIALERFSPDGVDVVVNTTSVGMVPDAGHSPIAESQIISTMTVMDVVYHPVCTRLLQMARQKGCRVIDGVDMFVGQGAEQFRLFTGHTPGVDDMKDIIIKELSANETD